MGEVIGVAVVVVIVLTIVCVAAVAGVNQKAKALHRSPTAALTSGDIWYNQALHMARLLDKLQDDDMVRPLIATKTAKEIQLVTEKFWELHDDETR